MEASPTSKPLNIVQIQIAPADNGFIIQGVSLDGENLSKRLVCTDQEGARKIVHEFADQLFVKVPVPTPTPSPTSDTPTP